MMRVHVGIVLYNSLDDLPACVAAVRAQTYSDVSIWALDNASPNGDAAWMREHAPDVRVIASAVNLGYGKGHNAIIRACQPGADDAYLALNPDARLEPDYIALLAAALKSGDDVGWATGKLRLADAAGAPTGLLYSAGHGLLANGYAFNIGHRLPDAPPFDADREVFGAPGAAALYKGALIADVSADGAFFDPDYFMYSEDVDVDWRARRRGWRCLYVADAAALHRGSHPGANSPMNIHIIGNRYLSAIKNAALRDLIFYNLPFMAAHCAARTLKTPGFGLKLTAHILRGAPKMLRKRRRPTMARSAMRAWFDWSARQPTTQIHWTQRRQPSTRR
jgi:GT2 family glycosyltransferase